MYYCLTFKDDSVTVGVWELVGDSGSLQTFSPKTYHVLHSFPLILVVFFFFCTNVSLLLLRFIIPHLLRLPLLYPGIKRRKYFHSNYFQ